MTPEEQAAKSAVENAMFGELIKPNAEDVKALKAHAQMEAALVEQQPVSDDVRGKPTLHGR